MWSVGSNVEAPAGYEWYVDGVLVQSGQNLILTYTTSTSDFVIEARVLLAGSGYVAAFQPVTVDASHPICLDQ